MAAVVFQLQTREKRVRKKGVETSEGVGFGGRPGGGSSATGTPRGRGANILSFLAPPLEPPSSKHTPPARGRSGRVSRGEGRDRVFSPRSGKLVRAVKIRNFHDGALIEIAFVRLLRLFARDEIISTRKDSSLAF